MNADLQTIRFRHPLIPSAIAQSAGLAERRGVHEALADVLRDQPDRRAWHRAALLSGEHEDVALELEAAGARARRRGAVAVAVTASRRAAELGVPASCSRRLLAAAGLAVELGRRDVVVALLGEVSQLELGELDRARVMWVEETALTRPLDAERYKSIIAAAEQAGAAGEHDLHVDLLWLAASRAWWVDPGPEVRRALIGASHRLGDANAEDPRVVAVHAYSDPWGHADGVLTRLKSAARDERLDTDAARFFGPAALVVGAFDVGYDFLEAAVDGLRTQGRLRHLPRLLMLYSCTAARLGDWAAALTAADEATRLAEEFADPQAAAAADTAFALVAAMRGDEQTAELMAARAEMVAEPVGANITMAFAQFGKVLAGLASGRHSDAYASADRLFDPADSAYHPVISSWLIADLAEAARHVDRLQDARARVAQVEASAGDRPGTWIALGLRHARALVAEPADAADRFEQALGGDLTRWPFQRARIQLAYGQWLRRHRRGRRFPRCLAGCAGHVRCARVRAVGRAGPARVACLGGAQPSPRARGSRPTDRARAADSPTCGTRAVEPRDRPAAVSLAPHDQHTPLPRLPEARHHLANRAGPGAGAAGGGALRTARRTPASVVTYETVRKCRHLTRRRCGAAATVTDDHADLTRGRPTTRRSSVTDVRNVVLVHGGFVDGSGWRGVYDLLKADGFNVTVVQNQTLSLESDVETTHDPLDLQDGPAILVGHSYGGVVITEAGRHERVAGLVYIAAFAPDAGESVNTLIADQPPGAPVPPILPPQDGFLFLDRAKFAESFAADLPADDAAFMADSQVPWGLEALNGAISEPAWRSQPSWYLVAADDRMIPPPAQRAMSQRAGATVVEAPGSHSIYVSQPHATADLIKQAAQRALAETRQAIG